MVANMGSADTLSAISQVISMAYGIRPTNRPTIVRRYGRYPRRHRDGSGTRRALQSCQAPIRADAYDKRITGLMHDLNQRVTQAEAVKAGTR